MAIESKLAAIQKDLKAPKDNYNSFGKYKYRTCEQILEAIKPFLAQHELLIILYDDIIEVGGQNYVKATVKLKDLNDGSFIETSAFARESATKSGMDAAQITGACSSYARKYALNGLFAIDDTKEADTDEHAEEAQQRAKKDTPKKQAAPAAAKAPAADPAAEQSAPPPVLCDWCQKPITRTEKYTAERIIKESENLFNGKHFCMDCLGKIKTQKKANEKAAEKAKKEGGAQNAE